MIWLMTLGYVVVAGMLLTASLPSRFSLFFKVIGVLVVTGLYFTTYLGHRSLAGWPINEELPKNFRLVWVAIDEPEKKDGVDGEIFFWIRELNDNNEAASKPRGLNTFCRAGSTFWVYPKPNQCRSVISSCCVWVRGRSSQSTQFHLSPNWDLLTQTRSPCLISTAS